MHVVSDKRFKELAEREEAGGDSLALRKQFACDEVKAINRDERQIDFVISTESPDRMNDIIKVNGWELDAFKKNPVVLFAHDNSEPPVAKAINIKVRPRKKQLTSRAEFAPRDISPFADSLFQLYDKGFMRATSVGFRPIEFEFTQEEGRPGGIDFTKTELLEFSLVPVPANPDALISARQKGIDTKPLVGWAERILDDWGEYKNSGMHVPRRMVEYIYNESKGSRSYNVPLKDQMSILRQNMKNVEDHLRESSKEEDEDMSTKDYKGAISWQRAHPNGTPKADKDETWDGGDVESALPNDVEENVDLYERVYAFHEGEEPPTTKGPWKLPHHKAEGDNAVVWNGVANAAARLPQTDMPDDEVPGVQDHLGRHYEEFDKTPPWEDEKLLPSWQAYQEACKEVEEDKDKFDQASSLCRKIFGEKVSKEVFSDERYKELFGEEKESKENKSKEGDKEVITQINVDSDEIMEKLQDRINEIREELREEFEEELEKEKAKLSNASLYDLAAKFLDVMDDAIENDNIPEATRKDKRVLRDTAESMNELFYKITGEKAVNSTPSPDTGRKNSTQSKSSVDEEEEIDLTDEEINEILDEKLSDSVDDLAKRAEDEINRIKGKVD